MLQLHRKLHDQGVKILAQEREISTLEKEKSNLRMVSESNKKLFNEKFANLEEILKEERVDKNNWCKRFEKV